MVGERTRVEREDKRRLHRVGRVLREGGEGEAVRLSELDVNGRVCMAVVVGELHWVGSGAGWMSVAAQGNTRYRAAV